MTKISSYAVQSICLVLLCLTPAQAATTVTTMHGPNPNFDHTIFDGMISNSDLIQGMIATELPGDTGWYPDNTNPADQLAAFTDGLGGVRILTGLLNDFPGEGSPTKVIQYDLAEPANIGGINILAGNSNNPDGRIFVAADIRYSTDNGATFAPLGGFVPGLGENSNGYYASDAPLTINRPGGSTNSPPNLETFVTFMSIFDDASPTMATAVTNLQFDFYATNNSDGWERDAFDGVNPFTNYDDGQPEAISSPLIWEIDVLEGPSFSADFNSDTMTDGQDFLIWQRGFGTPDAQFADGDATGDGIVDEADLAIWQGHYATSTSSLLAVPEPTTWSMLTLALLSLTIRRKCLERTFRS